MAEFDIETTISDIKLFIEKLKSDLPEVFTTAESAGQAAAEKQSGKVLYKGDLFDAKVLLDPATEKSKVAFEDNHFLITIKNEQEDIPALIENWLRQDASVYIEARAKEWAAKLGVEYNNIVIKDQRTLWGSCSQKHNINFSYRIIKMPKIIIDYLIVHELAHLIHFNHSNDYWATVSGFMPQYKEHRKWLNDNRYAVMAGIDVKYVPAAKEAKATTEQKSQPEEKIEEANLPNAS
ncbi:MAG: M48 family metallopeptidase [Elusimicrobiota bacterium]|jgi:predicted metal-dependent hydrolase|nr:M48 family metallopeptidase [Elusimicrobiota bacterium]